GGTPYDRSLDGDGDCVACHQATVTAGKYVSYVIPGGDWNGGVRYPGSMLAGSPTQFIKVTEVNLNRTGSLVTSTSSISATLYNMMLHISTALPPALNAGPTATPDLTKCWHCHHNTGNTRADGNPAQSPLFHANIGSAVPQDCNTCHYPLLADAAKSDLTNGTRYTMKHRSGQITFQTCQTCHTTALSKAANTPM